MAQYKRKDFAHYFNTAKSGTTEAERTLEGIGVEALALSYNPQIDTFKQIIDDVANSTFDSYQIQASVSGKRIESDDKIWKWLNEAREEVRAIESDMLEIDMKSSTGTTGSYKALKYKVLIVINEFLGENATISYDLYVKGSPEKGTATIANGSPSFTTEL